MSSLYGQKTHSYTGNMGQPWTLMLTLIVGVQGHRWILMPSKILLVIVQGGFGLDVGFCEKLLLGLSKASWKIHYSNLKLCAESSSQTWNIKVIAWLLTVLLMSIWVAFFGGVTLYNKRNISLPFVDDYQKMSLHINTFVVKHQNRIQFSKLCHCISYFSIPCSLKQNR